jgi:beta-galactosidase
MLHIVQDWNWAENEGMPIKVMVTSNADSVELHLNGRLVDKVSVDKYQMATFEMPYEAGLLEAIASKVMRGLRGSWSKRQAPRPCCT